MASRKPAARAKRITEFKADLAGMDDVFAKEERLRSERAQQREAALLRKGCESKNRYASRREAEDAIAACAAHGTRNLRCYRCEHCGGWHLTSKPPRTDAP